MLNVSLKYFVMLAVLVSLADVSFGQSFAISNTHSSVGPRIIFSQPKDADSGALYEGAQIRFSLRPNLKLEGSIDSRRSDFEQFVHVQVYPVQASILAYFTPNSTVSPFLLGGAGLYYTQVEGPLNFSYTTNRFGVHVGAGLEIMLNDMLSLDGSYRQLWIEKFTSRNTGIINKEYDDSGYMITLGLNILF